MAKPRNKKELVDRVILGVREYGISNVLFRNVLAEKLGVNFTDLECLGLLFLKGISTPTELSRHTGLSSGSTTAMLDRLERNGIIERRPNPDDRRGTLIVRGRVDLAPWFDSARSAQFNLVSSYSEKELELISEFLEKLIAMLDEERRKLQRNIVKT